MKVISLTNNEIKKLKSYKLHENIHNNESNLFLYKNDEILKMFKSCINIENKLVILNKLFYLEKYLDVREFVLPKFLVRCGKRLGYTMEYVRNNTNLAVLLNDDNISLHDKIYFFTRIGNLLKKIEKNDVLKENGFHLGDIHEGNFIYDNINNMVRAVDLDSSYVTGMEAPDSKFLTFNDKLWDFPNKYPLDKNDRHVPNKNSTILSFLYMVMNLVSEEYSPNLSTREFCYYINIMAHVGFHKELLDNMFDLYLYKDNSLDFDLIKTITPELILKFREIKNVKK